MFGWKRNTQTCLQIAAELDCHGVSAFRPTAVMLSHVVWRRQTVWRSLNYSRATFYTAVMAFRSATLMLIAACSAGCIYSKYAHVVVVNAACIRWPGEPCLLGIMCSAVHAVCVAGGASPAVNVARCLLTAHVYLEQVCVLNIVTMLVKRLKQFIMYVDLMCVSHSLASQQQCRLNPHVFKELLRAH